MDAEPKAIKMAKSSVKMRTPKDLEERFFSVLFFMIETFFR